MAARGQGPCKAQPRPCELLRVQGVVGQFPVFETFSDSREVDGCDAGGGPEAQAHGLSRARDRNRRGVIRPHGDALRMRSGRR
jgi:hypothetical protein